MDPTTRNGQNMLIMEALIENLPGGVVLVDREKKVILANKKMVQLTHLPKEGFYLTELSKLFEERIDLGAELDKILSTSVSPVVVLHDIPLKKLFYSLSCFQVFDDTKNLIGGAIFLQDITQEKEIDTEKSEFISIASHQLRTPLGSMRWNLEMLGEYMHLLPEQAQKNFYEAYKSNRRAIWMVADLLNVSRIEEGKTEDEPQPTDLAVMIRSIIQEVVSETEMKSISITFTPKKENIPKVKVDPAHFRDVMENLVSNAVKYTKAGGKITITLDQLDTAVQVSIQDTGIGIPEDDKKKIFSKFFRSKNAVRVYTESSGLGLFIAKTYVEKWGGKLWFESTEKQGTTFYVTIPLA